MFTVFLHRFAVLLCIVLLCSVPILSNARVFPNERFARIDTDRVARLTVQTRSALSRRRVIRTGVLAASAVCGLVQAGLLVKELATWLEGEKKAGGMASGPSPDAQSWQQWFESRDTWIKGAKSVGAFGLALGANIIYNRLYDRVMP